MFVISRIVWILKWNIYDKYESIDKNVYSKKVANLVGTVVTYVLMIFNALIAFQIMWLDVGILMAWIAFGIWFAMEKTFANIVAAMLLVTNPKIKTWELIRMLWNFNCSGRIERISARHSVVKLLSGQRLIVPNTTFSKISLQTISQEPIVRNEICVDIDLQSDVNQAKQVLRDAINEHPDIMHKEKTYINATNVGETGITLSVYFHSYPKSQRKWILALKSDIRNIIHSTLRANKITIPYPHSVVNIA